MTPYEELPLLLSFSHFFGTPCIHAQEGASTCKSQAHQNTKWYITKGKNAANHFAFVAMEILHNEFAKYLVFRISTRTLILNKNIENSSLFISLSQINKNTFSTYFGLHIINSFHVYHLTNSHSKWLILRVFNQLLVILVKLGHENINVIPISLISQKYLIRYLCSYQNVH